MGTALDAVLEVFTWVGFGGAAVLVLVAVVAWAADGTWLPVEAYVDHEGDVTTVRWFDHDGDPNSACPSEAEVTRIGTADRADIWYRHGWHGRMRLTRRAPVLRLLAWASAALVTIGLVATVVSWILLFTTP